MKWWKGLECAACLCALVTLVGACGPEPHAEADTVVLVHGLGRTPASMAILQARLAGAGYRIVNFGYPSRSETLEALTDSLRQAVRDCCSASTGTVHFVTHSMGGVLVRSYLADRTEPFEGRVVMLSPPNQGSEIVDAFADSPFLRSLLGPAGVRLGTDSTGIASELGPVDFDLGIITGDRSLNPIGSWLIPGPDDGKVGVARARLEGATDFLVVHATHTFIMNRGDVAEQVAHFLEHGEFLRESPEAEASIGIWPACDGPDTDPWVTGLRDRVLAYDELAGFAVESYGAPLTCEGAVTSEFDGMPFGSLRLGFSGGASLLVETIPPEASAVALRAPGGFADEAVARRVLEDYTERVGVEIDWAAPEITEQNDGRVQQYRDPDSGLNASASLVYSGGSLVGLSFSTAL
jgi:pimeloyl-ACP methyl ester carboxylesterase